MHFSCTVSKCLFKNSWSSSLVTITMQPAFITVAFRGEEVKVYMSQNTTFASLMEQVQQHIQQPLALHTLKLLSPNKGTPALHVHQQANEQITDAGKQPIQVLSTLTWFCKPCVSF